MTTSEAAQPPWMARAWAELGQREVAGRSDNPRILEYYKDAGTDGATHDEVAWCAAFVGACLERSGIAGTRSLAARSYLEFGQPLDAARPGAIAVLSRGADPALGHVGFWVGEEHGSILLLGGNQGDAVSVAAFDRSRLLGLRWPSATEVASTRGVAPASVAVGGGDADRVALYNAALAHVLKMEGGWSDDPYDPGGPTNQGITLETYANWRGERLTPTSRARLVSELKAIAADVVRDIYRTRYWQPCRAGLLPPPLALMHFDSAVNHGVGGAARMLQEALDVGVDGEIGPQTLAAAGGGDPVRAVADYAAVRRRRYRALPHFWRFGRGWLNRVDATQKAALALPVVTASTIPATAKGVTTMNEVQNADLNPAVDGGAGKWWGESMTMWGVILTTLSSVLPVVGPLVGIDISAEVIRQIGAQATAVIQAIGALTGTLLTVYGRSRASLPLVRREMRVRL